MIIYTSTVYVKPKHRGVFERSGKVVKILNPGFYLIIPVIDQVRSVFIGEQVLDSSKKSFLTNDNKNVNLDIKVFYHLKSHDQSLIRALHEINDYPKDISVALQISMERIIGDLPLSSIQNYLLRIKVDLFSELVIKVNHLGIEIDRVEVN